MAKKLDLKSLSHHAYYLIGGALIHGELLSILEKDHHIHVKGNPDFLNRTYTNFTIEDSRELKSSAEMRPVGKTGKKVFVLMMDSITVEAQNALLKLLEEPTEYSHFFLIVPSAHLLLPTVKSRMSLLGEAGGGRQEAGEDSQELMEAKKFLKLSTPKQLEYIKSLMEDIAKEKKTKQDGISFLNAIEAAVYEDKGAKAGRKELEAIQVSRKYITDRAPSMKMLLEYVALNL